MKAECLIAANHSNLQPGLGSLCKCSEYLASQNVKVLKRLVVL